jgi:TetR/AcrR family transcriptional regulator of autoinduction and epiphytic fitness
MTAAAQQPVVDGRAARSQRTRSAIVEAHVELLRRGILRPTGAQIAARAGISVRSLWIHFPELEALFAATAAEVLAEQDLAFRPVEPALPLADRIDGFCRQRAALLERVAPFARASVLIEPSSPTLREFRRIHVRRVADEVLALFGSELGRLPGVERAEALEAVVAATTWGAWITLRDDRQLDRSRSQAVMARTMRALLSTHDPNHPAPGQPTRDQS